MDFLVLVLTWVKTFSQWRESRRLGLSKSITESLIRDGTIYFLLLLGVNLAQILTYNLTFAPVNLLIAVMPSLLVSRFLLNLRQVAENPSPLTSDGIDTVALSQFSAPRFNVADSVFGNLGEPIGLGEDSESFESSGPDTLQEAYEMDGPEKDVEAPRLVQDALAE
ncbi:hypothetical protein PsYK624_049520 [Phanerochaete sordida]|uniref:Uncharacterized protein n=1 Tax=Phanerochaete sordida TaxID=48140 RepID=A0A9P3G6S7_9APHY|nr:hypothetical protein PsYK624_049520 [Phanerochaete sordida]